jgi:hypothetical protein
MIVPHFKTTLRRNVAGRLLPLASVFVKSVRTVWTLKNCKRMPSRTGDFCFCGLSHVLFWDASTVIQCLLDRNTTVDTELYTCGSMDALGAIAGIASAQLCEQAQREAKSSKCCRPPVKAPAKMKLRSA